MTCTDVRWRRNHAINAWPLDRINQWKCRTKFIYTCVLARIRSVLPRLDRVKSKLTPWLVQVDGKN